MKISATVRNSADQHQAEVSTDASTKELHIPAKSLGRGSSINGGELLMLALATCYCNDLFREAGPLGITLDDIEVTASGEFLGAGLAAENIRYSARIKSQASKSQIDELISKTDQVAEIHNTIRLGTPVTLDQ